MTNEFSNNIKAPDFILTSDSNKTLSTIDSRLATVETWKADFTVEMLKKVYPVGAVYLSFSSTSPADLFGFGTWLQITNRFLYCYNGSNSTGGSNEIPYHNHDIDFTSGAGTAHSHGCEGAGNHNHIVYGYYNGNWSTGLSADGFKGSGGDIGAHVTLNNTHHFTTDYPGNHSHTINNESAHTHSIKGNTTYVGDSNSTNNMPAYITTYAWRRTA